MITETLTLLSSVATPTAVVTATVTPTPTLPPFDGTLNGLVAIVGLTIIFVLVFLLFNWLRTFKQGYPLEQRIEAALLPYLHGIISGAFEETHVELDKIEDAVENLDKAELAARIYDLLPESIAGYDISVLQSIFTVEQFTDIFLRVYHEVKVFYADKKGEFVNLFDKWNTGN